MQSDTVDDIKSLTLEIFPFIFKYVYFSTTACHQKQIKQLQIKLSKRGKQITGFCLISHCHSYSSPV